MPNDAAEHKPLLQTRHQRGGFVTGNSCQTKCNVYLRALRFDGGTFERHAKHVSTSSRRPKARSAQRTGSATIADVATLATVSKMSISRYLRDPLTVGEPLRSRIQQAIASLNYVPNRAAQMLAGVSQIRVGLLYNHPRSAYAVDLLLGAMDQAAIADVQLLVRGCTLSGDDTNVLRDLLSQQVDAIILTPPLCESRDLNNITSDAKIPTVLIGTNDQFANCVSLGIDEFSAAYEMTTYIASLGHVRIAFIEGARAISASVQRLEGYEKALEDAGIKKDSKIISSGLFTYRSGLEAADRLLNSSDRPTAIFASNDDMASATISTAHRLGLAVPTDVTVCGFDDSWIATNIWPELTTVQQPVSMMGSEAITIAKNLVSHRNSITYSNNNVRFPHKIILRGSHDLPSKSHLR